MKVAIGVKIYPASRRLFALLYVKSTLANPVVNPVVNVEFGPLAPAVPAPLTFPLEALFGNVPLALYAHLPASVQDALHAGGVLCTIDLVLLGAEITAVLNR